MRIWDVPPSKLCRKHLLGEHRELHALYNILLHNKKGYRSHPETLRWVGKLPALKKRHQLIVEEMNNRSYNHYSDLKESTGLKTQDELIATVAEQEQILKEKPCDCPIK